MASKISRRLKLASRKISLKHISKQLHTARVVRNFAEGLGLIYFGTVSRDRSGQAAIKGITASNTYFDRHFSTGSFKGYDITMLVRRDTIAVTNHNDISFAWTVLKLNLDNRNDLAPLAIIDNDMIEVYSSKFSNLQRLLPLRNSSHAQQFIERFSVLGRAANRLDVYKLLNDNMLQNLTFQTQKYSIELVDNELYIYIPAKYPTKNELTWQMNFGIWLAQNIDRLALD